MTLEEIANQRNLPQPKEELSTEKLLTLITKLNEENANLTKRIERAEHSEREITNAEHCKNEMWKSYQRMLSEVVKVKRKNDDLLADAVTMRVKLRKALEKKEIVYRDKIVYKDRPVPAPKCEACFQAEYKKMYKDAAAQKEEYERSIFLAERCRIFIFFVFIYAVCGLLCTALLLAGYFIIVIIEMYLENNK